MKIKQVTVESGSVHMKIGDPDSRDHIGIRIIPDDKGVRLSFEWADVKVQPVREFLNQVFIPLTRRD